MSDNMETMSVSSNDAVLACIAEGMGALQPQTMTLVVSILSKCVQFPDVPKYRSIKLSNAKFSSLVWSVPQAQQYLLAAGFQVVGDEAALPADVSAINALDVLVATFPQFAEGMAQQQPQQQHQQQPSQVSNAPVAVELPKMVLRAPGRSQFDEAQPDMTLLASLVEMGFAHAHASRALVQTCNAGLQEALDWLTTHEDALAAPEASQTTTTTQHNAPSSYVAPAAPAPVLYAPTHPAPVYASSYTPAIPEIASVPVSRTQAKLHEGREAMNNIKRMKEMEDAQRAKLLDKQARENVLKELTSDRILLAQKQGKLVPDAAPVAAPRKLAQTTHSIDATHEALVKIRMPDGRSIEYQGKAGDDARAISRHVVRSAGLAMDTFELLDQATRAVLDQSATLLHLGLAPKGVVIVQKLDSKNVIATSSAPYVPAHPLPGQHAGGLIMRQRPAWEREYPEEEHNEEEEAEADDMDQRDAGQQYHGEHEHEDDGEDASDDDDDGGADDVTAPPAQGERLGGGAAYSRFLDSTP